MIKDNTIEAFFALVRAGLWGNVNANLNLDVNLNEGVDWGEVYRLAEEQSMIGLVAAGLDRFKVNDSRFTVPQMVALQFIGQTLQIEQRNKAMNIFLGELVEDMRRKGIYTLLVKGQSIAQCYEKPLWRSAGDIDFYLSDDNFKQAKQYFRYKVDSIDPDDDYAQHVNMHYGEWVVEIHSNQYSGMSRKIDRVLADIHQDLFFRGNVRSCIIDRTQVFIPSYENDILIVFTHFLKHFYMGGLGIRQICDWCRLLWTARDKIDLNLLELRLKEMKLMSEWKAFGAFAVDYLGMTRETMPFYDVSKKWCKKAALIKEYVLEVGNFGHNRDSSYYGKHSFLVRKALSFMRRCSDMKHHSSIFPLDSFRFLIGKTISGFIHVVHGE